MSSSGITSVRPLNIFWDTKDPFLYCAYHVDAYPAGNASGGPNVSLQGRKSVRILQEKTVGECIMEKIFPDFQITLKEVLKL